MGAATAAALEAALTELFPPFVSLAVAPCLEESSPHEEEVRAVARAVPRRRREFLSGRACAHRALAELGLDTGSIRVGPRREPLWPAGAVGSIAHAGGWSGAVVAPASEAWGLGFDLEVLDPPLADDVDRLVRTRAERGQGPAPGHPLAAHVGKLVFSIKEAVYKCLFPPTRWRLEFGDVGVATGLDGRYTATVDERFDPASLGLGLVEGSFAVVDGYVLTALCIPGDDTRPARCADGRPAS